MGRVGSENHRVSQTLQTYYYAGFDRTKGERVKIKDAAELDLTNLAIRYSTLSWVTGASRKRLSASASASTADVNAAEESDAEVRE